MPRKNESIINLLVEAPWWISVTLSAASWIVLRYIIPSIESQDMVTQAVATAAPQVAHIFAFIFLIPAPISFFKSYRKKKLLDSRKGLDSIRALPWKEFEELVAEAYRRQGFAVFENSSAGPDGGIDLTLKKAGCVELVQCKNWRTQKVGVRVVREMYGIMTDKSAHGVKIICSGMFTQEAQNFAGNKPIDLIGGNQLLSLIEDVQKEAPTNQTAPASMSSETNPVCPKCGSGMILRKAKTGKYKGQPFWGCSDFPRCKGLKQIEN